MDGLGGFRGFSGFGEFDRFGGFNGSLKGFSVSFNLLLKVYTWLKVKLETSRKERFIPRYLQYGVLGDCVF